MSTVAQGAALACLLLIGSNAPMRRRLRGVQWAAILVAMLVFVGGVGFLWTGPDSDWGDRCPAALSAEGSSSTVEASLWPPGSKCEGTTPTGEAVSRTYVPWREWGLVGLLAGAIFLTGIGMGRSARQRAS